MKEFDIKAAEQIINNPIYITASNIVHIIFLLSANLFNKFLTTGVAQTIPIINITI